MEYSMHFGGPVSNREVEDIWSVEVELDWLLITLMMLQDQKVEVISLYMRIPIYT